MYKSQTNWCVQCQEDVKVFEIIFSRHLLCKAVKDALSVRCYHRLQTVFLTGQFSSARPVFWQERWGILSGSLSLHLLHISVAPFGKGVLFSKNLVAICAAWKEALRLGCIQGQCLTCRPDVDSKSSSTSLALGTSLPTALLSFPVSLLARLRIIAWRRKKTVVIRPVRFGGGNCWSKLFWRRRKLTTGGNWPAVSQN